MVELELNVTAHGESSYLRWSFAEGNEVCVIGYLHTIVRDLRTDMAGLMSKHTSTASLTKFENLLRLSLDCSKQTSHAVDKCARLGEAKDEADEEVRSEHGLAEETSPDVNTGNFSCSPTRPQSTSTATILRFPGAVSPVAEAQYPDRELRRALLHATGERVHSTDSLASIRSDISNDLLESAKVNSKMLILMEAEVSEDSGDLGAAQRDAPALVQPSHSAGDAQPVAQACSATSPARHLHGASLAEQGTGKNEILQEIRHNSKDSTPSILPDAPQDLLDSAIENSKKLLPRSSQSFSYVARRANTPSTPRTAKSFVEHRTSRASIPGESASGPSTFLADQPDEHAREPSEEVSHKSAMREVRRPRNLPHLPVERNKYLTD